MFVQCNQTDIIVPSAGTRGTAPLLVRSGVSGLQVMYVTDEKELFQELVTIMRRCVFGPQIVGTATNTLKISPKTKNQFFFSILYYVQYLLRQVKLVGNYSSVLLPHYIKKN